MSCKRSRIIADTINVLQEGNDDRHFLRWVLGKLRGNKLWGDQYETNKTSLSDSKPSEGQSISWQITNFLSKIFEGIACVVLLYPLFTTKLVTLVNWEEDCTDVEIYGFSFTPINYMSHVSSFRPTSLIHFTWRDNFTGHALRFYMPHALSWLLVRIHCNSEVWTFLPLLWFVFSTQPLADMPTNWVRLDYKHCYIRKGYCCYNTHTHTYI